MAIPMPSSLPQIAIRMEATLQKVFTKGFKKLARSTFAKQDQGSNGETKRASKARLSTSELAPFELSLPIWALWLLAAGHKTGTTTA
jgi:hypothetical protein